MSRQFKKLLILWRLMMRTIGWLRWDGLDKSDERFADGSGSADIPTKIKMLRSAVYVPHSFEWSCTGLEESI